MTGSGGKLRYDEGCLGAHALNLVGDRWALLVVRELMFRPKRFQMIRTGLPGITASVLTQRLGQLVSAGIVRHDADMGSYALTPAGRDLHPVLVALCVWALRMPGHDPLRFISPSALMISISATVDARRARGSGLRGAFLIGREGFEVGFDDRGRPAVAATSDPAGAFRIAADGNRTAAALYGPGGLAALAGAGLIALSGDAVAARSFVDLFSLTPSDFS